MNKQDLRTLKTELTDDPEELGYAEKSHEELAAILNATQRNVERASFTGAMLVSCIDKAEYEAFQRYKTEHSDWTTRLKKESVPRS